MFAGDSRLSQRPTAAIRIQSRNVDFAERRKSVKTTRALDKYLTTRAQEDRKLGVNSCPIPASRDGGNCGANANDRLRRLRCRKGAALGSSGQSRGILDFQFRSHELTIPPRYDRRVSLRENPSASWIRESNATIYNKPALSVIGE